MANRLLAKATMPNHWDKNPVDCGRAKAPTFSATEMLGPFPDFGAGHWSLNAGKVPGHATNVYLAGWSSHQET